MNMKLLTVVGAYQRLFVNKFFIRKTFKPNLFKYLFYNRNMFVKYYVTSRQCDSNKVN